MAGDLPLPHDWLVKDEGLPVSPSSSFSFDFTGASSSMGTPAPSPAITLSVDFNGALSAAGTSAPSVIALIPSAGVTPAPAPKVTPAPITIPILPGLQITPMPTAQPKIPVVSIRLRMGGNSNKRQEGVNAILGLIGRRLKVKGKIYRGRRDNGATGANNGQGNNGQSKNGQNGKNGRGANRAPENTSGTNENANNNGQNSNSKPDKCKPNTPLLDAFSSSRILQGTIRMALEEQGVLCVEDTEQEEMDIDFEKYADEDKVRSLVEGMRNGSIPVTLPDGTPVRDMVCQAETSMSMVAIFSDVPDSSDALDGSDVLDGADSKGSGLSTHNVILIAVMGGVTVLFVSGCPLFIGVVLFLNWRAARVTQI